MKYIVYRISKKTGKKEYKQLCRIEQWTAEERLAYRYSKRVAINNTYRYNHYSAGAKFYDYGYEEVGYERI